MMWDHPNTDLFSKGLLVRRVVLQTLLGLTVSCGVFFFVLNLQRGNQSIAIAEMVMSIYAGGLLTFVRSTRHLRRWTLAYLIPFFLVMLLACWSPRTTPVVFVWVLLIPIIAHLLLGRWMGLAFSTFFMAGAGLIFIWKLASTPEQFPPVAIADVVLCAGCIFGLSHVYEVSREQTEARLRQMAMLDSLTGLANRSRFHTVFERAREDYNRNGNPVSVLLIDLDYFKRVNDTYGHDAGDAVLCFVARLFEHQLRQTDLLCRLGGEEFGVMLANTATEQAVDVAETLRRSIAAEHFVYEKQEIDLTVTIGVAELGTDGDDLKTLLSCADQRLYEGKNEGRDQVIGRAEKQRKRA